MKVGSRRLNENGDIIHYKESIPYKSGTVPRDEAVFAIQGVMDGKDNFLAVSTSEGGNLVFDDLTRDRMVLSLTGDGLSGEFTAKDAFLESFPDVMVTLHCPAEKDGSVCDVTFEGKTSKKDELDDELVSCFSIEDSSLQDDFPSECMDVVYDASLYVIPGPHFFIGAKKQETNQINCPDDIAFRSSAGNKHRLHVYGDDLKGLPVHSLGAASLKDILEAEDGAEALSDSTYKLFTNSCVHYARRIWSVLGFEETEELANFIIRNVVDDENFVDLAGRKTQHGGMRALATAAFGGKSALEKLLKDVVDSQRYIV